MTDNLTDGEHWDNLWTILKKQSVNEFAVDIHKNYLSKMNKDISILDLGSGYGVDSEYFYNDGYKNITAVDFSGYALKLLKEKIDINTIKADLRSLELEKKSFDIIYAHCSLHYFKDDLTKDLFKRCFNWLKDDGLLFIKCKSVNDKKMATGVEVEKNVYIPEGEKDLRHLFTKEYMEECLNYASNNTGKIISVKELNAAYYTNNNSAFIEAIYKKES